MPSNWLGGLIFASYTVVFPINQLIMKTNLMFLAAALLVAACSPKAGNTTKVVGQFAGNAPETVRITKGYIDGLSENEEYIAFFDTTVAVVNGRFEVEIPKDVTTQMEFRFGEDYVTFISDGSTITIDPDARTAVSSDGKGLHSLYEEFGSRWNDYQGNLFGFGADREAGEKYRNENLGTLLAYTKEIARNNLDNVNGLNALEMLYFSSLDGPVGAQDPEEMLALVNGLSDEMKTAPMSSVMYSELFNIYDGLVKTTEGKPFVDFTVVQDPDNPEASTAKFSDYIGKGKYVLVDFWASWCGPCRAEMPNLVDVYNAYHGDNFDMLSIAVMDDVARSAEAAKELGIVWNQIVNAQQIPSNAYGFNAIPLIMLFGPDGTILKRDIRGEQIGAAVKEALGI